MNNQRLVMLLAALLALIFAACQPQIESAPAPDTHPTAAPAARSETAEPPSSSLPTQTLEAVTPSPEAANLEGFTVPDKTATPSPEPQDPAAKGVAPDRAAPEPSAEEVYPQGTQALIEAAVKDLANRHSLAREKIEVVSFESKVWPDSSLGCPQPGMRYLQVLTEGYLIRLRSGDTIVNYHGGRGREPFLCEQPGPGKPVSK